MAEWPDLKLRHKRCSSTAETQKLTEKSKRTSKPGFVSDAQRLKATASGYTHFKDQEDHLEQQFQATSSEKLLLL